MGFRCGIVGLPNVGKSTIFNAVTRAGAQAANYPFCTIDPNVGRVNVPDPRLDEIVKLVPTLKIVPAAMEFVDIAGLVRGASKGEGLGNQFLGHIRETDAILHVVRCFESDEITHVEGSVGPLRDIETIEAELIFADDETVAKAIDRTERLLKGGDKKHPIILQMYAKLKAHLGALRPARTCDLEANFKEHQEVYPAYRDLHLITGKRVLYVCNVEEGLARGDADNTLTKQVKEHAAKEGAGVVIISGKIEEELSELDDASRTDMIKDLGMQEPGLSRLIRAGYELLNLQTYFTAGEKEVRAWTIHKGDKAPAAAGKIHSDFERGFICAEVFTLADLKRLGTKARLKEQGLIRTEGKEYVMQDGDIVEFRFNV